ncbi:MAG: T9SS type A sorting domain-containing protein [Bacteroidota bacterium]|nr:T9SS type A sorting domain-containing protein [Bacteroidota bacterium]
MKQVNYFISIVVMVVAANSAEAQTIQYHYDNAGNRESRVIVVGGGGQKSMISDNQNQATLEELLKIEETISETIGEIEITIYPNPNQGQMVVQIDNIPDEIKSSIVVYDLAGKAIFRKEYLTKYTDVDITDSPNGTYILKIIVGKETSEWKVIKK